MYPINKELMLTQFVNILCEARKEIVLQQVALVKGIWRVLVSQTERGLKDHVFPLGNRFRLSECQRQ